MICPSCDTPNREDARFCKKCGHPFSTQTVKMPEQAAVSQTSMPMQEEDISAVDDPNLAPTQIISPQQMLAFHATRWQKETESEQAEVNVGGNATAKDEADVPTIVSTQIPVPSSTLTQNNESASNYTGSSPDSTSMTSDSEPVSISPPPSSAIALEEEAIPIPPPPPSPSTESASPFAQSTEVTAQDKDNNLQEIAPEVQSAATMGADGSTTHREEDKGVTQTSADQPDQPDQTASSSNFPVLAVGTMLNGRYEITQIVSEDLQGHVYDVTDHQGYHHCWNCGSEQNREGDEFCIDCGAELLNASYTMHEYPSTGNSETEANVLQGSIVNTFVEHGHTYVIEQIHAAENAFPNGVHMIAACDSDAGNVRRSDPNEDSTLVLMLQRVHESRSFPEGVFIVADGMGGHDNGQGASLLAISTIAERMVRELLGMPLVSEKAGEAEKERDEDAYVSLLQGTVEDANAAICQVNQRDKTDMGSTITGFMVVGDYAYILNVGDSRTYMVRGGQIYQLTNDHSLVGQLVAGGLIQPDDVYTHPQRSQIFRSLGDKLNVQIDIFKQQLHPGDILLSCSDGLWEMVRNPQIESILNNAPDPQMACTQLLEAANTNGGEDNVSAVVVFVR
ncbi:MAG: hypothetical protein NVS4B7_05530 [Ktedonobacteraceae bacterium]